MGAESVKAAPSTNGKSASSNTKQNRTSEGTNRTAGKTNSDDSTKAQTNGSLSEADRRKESSKLSRQALAARKKAQELREAANGAADPDERQHLMEQAINTQIEAETFGKTARYLQSGAFQGMVAGTGMGSVPGLTLGTLTGTLVGGTVTMITGGLGGAIGAATGALHGPFWDMGKLAGKGIRKVTGDLPGWKATDKQKATLEKMMGQVKEQDDPSEADLNSMADWEAQEQDNQTSQTWAEYGASYLPSMSTGAQPKANEDDGSAPSSEKTKQKDVKVASTKDTQPDKSQDSSQSQKSSNTLQQAPDRRKSVLTQPRQSNDSKADKQKPQQQASSAPPKAPSSEVRKRPRKLNRQKPARKPEQASQSQIRKKPRKLEVRSGGSWNDPASSRPGT